MKFAEIKKRVVDCRGRAYYDRRYCIYNEFGPIAFVWADSAQDAIDEAADAGKLDGQAMSDDDYAEYEANGWQDSFIFAGNASEPFWSEYLGIQEITK